MASRHRSATGSHHRLTPSDPYLPNLEGFQYLHIQNHDNPQQDPQTSQIQARQQQQPPQFEASAFWSGTDSSSNSLDQSHQLLSATGWPDQNEIPTSTWPQAQHNYQLGSHNTTAEDVSPWNFDSGLSQQHHLKLGATHRPYGQALEPIHEEAGRKRLSSASSIASFGPHTPQGSQFVPRVEVYDPIGQAYNSTGHLTWDAPHPQNQEDWYKHYGQQLGYPQECGLHRQAQQAQHCPARYAQYLQQLMMSQGSNLSNGGMAPPALPRTESSDSQSGCRNGDAAVPKLNRTMSDIYQDSLYNPNLHQAPPSPPPTSQLPKQQSTSPKGNVMRDRLAAANVDHLKARSQSPTANIARERSPFKPNAPESPRQDQFPAHAEPVTRPMSMAQLREWQKAQHDSAAAARHTPSDIKQELNQASKTISPKEVALDYEEDEEAAKMGSLFPIEPPAKRLKKNHGAVSSRSMLGKRESTRESNASDISQPSFASMATSRRESSNSNGRSQVQYPFFANAVRQASSASNVTATESTAEFPAHFTSTESTRSDHEPSLNRKRPHGATSPRLKADDTGAINDDAFTYTCTYHNCTSRFDTQAALQKHKRDIHHSTAHHSRNTSVVSTIGGGPSASPVAPSSRSTPAIPSTADPAETEGHTASPSAIAERNSQAGPHICNRINPTTGRPCNSQFSRPYDLTRHEDTIHNNKKQKIRCMYCKDEKTFSRNDALTRHMRVVHEDVDFPGKQKKRSG